MGGAPGVPAGGGDELAARTVGGDLVGGGDDRVDLEATLVVGGEAAAEVPVRQAWGVLAVEAVRVGLPQLDLGVGEGGAVRRAHLALEGHGLARLVVAHRDGAVRALLGRPGHVVRTLDGALVALAVVGVDVLDDVLEPHVEEERPLAVLADLDQPALEGVVLLVGEAVLADDLVQGLQRVGRDGVHALRGHVERALLLAEGGGRVGAGVGGARLERGLGRRVGVGAHDLSFGWRRCHLSVVGAVRFVCRARREPAWRQRSTR